jgi:hypothetical protein
MLSIYFEFRTLNEVQKPNVIHHRQNPLGASLEY